MSKSDIEIARAATMKPITEVGERLGIASEHLLNYGPYKAKISLEYIKTLKDKPDGKLILVTAMTPTPAGEGKTTTSVGLGDAMNRIGKKTAMCLREPSLGPCFGMKGGAAGGGYAQVVPWKTSIYILPVIFTPLVLPIIYYLPCWTIIFIGATN